MIEIKCVAADTAWELCASQQLSATLVLEMTERGKRLGWCAAAADGEKARVLFLCAPDAALTDALLRALLNTLRANGVAVASIVDEALALFMVHKGYFSALQEKTIKIADFFANSTCKA